MRCFEADIQFKPIPEADLLSLIRQRIPAAHVANLIHEKTCEGIINGSGFFDPDPRGDRFICFPERYDTVFWHPTTGRTSTLMGRVFALNEDHVDNPATFSFDANLNIYGRVIDWLAAGRDGIVVLDWSKAFDRLRAVPRIAIDERLLPTYRKSMQPPRLPRVFVIPSAGRKAA